MKLELVNEYEFRVNPLIRCEQHLGGHYFQKSVFSLIFHEVFPFFSLVAGIAQTTNFKVSLIDCFPVSVCKYFWAYERF